MTIDKVLAKNNPRFLSSGQIKMRCVFRENHTDGSGEQSLFLSPEINGYHCFSCKAKGRMTQLLMDKFDVSYYEAVEMVHVDTDAYIKKKVEFEIAEPWVIEPPEEFLDRGYRKSTLKHFRVGKTLEGTICIPVTFQDHIKGVVYQIREEGKNKRVWHSVGLPKREILYNYDTRYKYAVLVEGPTDVWRIFEHKHNATGGLGSDLTKEQAELLQKFDDVYLMGDNDIAGIRFNEIAYQRLKNHVNVLVIPYLAEDPGEISMREFVRGFKGATDYLTYSMAMTEHPRYEKIRQEVIKTLDKEND